MGNFAKDSDDEDSGDESDHGSDHSDDDSHDDSHEDSDREYGWHVLPSPKHHTLDMAIEKATRVGVTMVRMQLETFSNTMAHYLQYSTIYEITNYLTIELQRFNSGFSFHKN